MVNNIKNNTIRETLAKQHLNALNEIKKEEIKNKRLINGQKELLNLFDDLLTTLSNSNNKNNNNNDNNSNNKNNNSNSENDSENKNKNKNDNENENENESENENENKSENENENESENKKDNANDNDDDYEIKEINDCFKMIDKTKSFEEQINL